MPPIHPQVARLLWTDSRDDDAIAVAVKQVRHWQQDQMTPAMIYAVFGVRYVPRRGDDPWPSWDDAVWLVAEAWNTLPQWRDDEGVCVAPGGQFAFPFPLPAARGVLAGSGRQAPSQPGRLPDSHDRPWGEGDGPGTSLPQQTDSAAVAERRDGMSRIRSIDPSQWTEEDFVACSPAARLLLLGLRNEADDRGVFEWRPVSLKMRLLPADPVDISALLAELVDNRQIARFEADGRSYGLCLVWGQKPRRPHYRYPAPPPELEQRSGFPADVGNDRASADPLPDSVGNETASSDPIPASRAEQEQEQEQGRAKQGEGGPAPGGAALSPDFDLPDDWLDAAGEERRRAGLPEVNLAAEWGKFRQHHGGERRTLPTWRRRWLKWALDARAALGADPPAATPAEPATAASETPRSHQLGAAGDRLMQAIGAAEFGACFAGVSPHPSISGFGAVHLVVPTGAVAARLRERHERQICEAFGQRRVEIYVRELERTEPGNAAVAPPPPAGAGEGKPRRRRRSHRAQQPSILLPVPGGAGAEKGEASPGPEQRRGAA